MPQLNKSVTEFSDIDDVDETHELDAESVRLGEHTAETTGGSMDIALLLIRIVVGGTVAAHGAQKLFGWFGGYGIEGTAGYLESLGFRTGRPYAWLSGVTEFAGGLALAAGLLTPLGAAAVAGVMLTAVAAAHWGKGFFLATGGCEFPLALGVVALACAFSGGGRWSLDNALGWTLDGGGWGITAVILAVVASAAVMAAGGIAAHRRGGEQPAT